MAKQGVVSNAVPWTHLREMMFDSFFGQKLSYEGFTMEKVAGGYLIVSNLIASLFLVQKAELSR